MAEHKYAQVLRWIADGKAVQSASRRVGRVRRSRARSSVYRSWDIYPPEDYRLKPRTVKIGNREVEAPVLEPEEGQKLWFWNSMDDEYDSYLFDPDVSLSIKQAKRGEMFATREACNAATEAWFALLRGDA